MRIIEIWRYPIASIGGERLPSATTDRTGLIGDRAFSVVCRETGEVANPEDSAKWRTAPMVAARGYGLNLEIRTPKTDWLPAFGRTAGAALNEHFGFEVALKRTGSWDDPVTVAGRARPRYPRAPLHLVSLQMLEALQAAVPGKEMSAQRFRANLVVDLSGQDERAALRPGVAHHFRQTSIKLTGPTERCAFVALEQAEVPRSPDALRIIRDEYGMRFGHYAQVVRAGRLFSSPHDEVRTLDTPKLDTACRKARSEIAMLAE